ncbi:carboxypeptidase-like regulatory domain-containing protein [Marinilabiliaceae bacterium JC040]|nr:carboxypeptidase-like regulatory domain-containing protein [Marinilabiliaceae bacterium JC040]
MRKFIILSIFLFSICSHAFAQKYNLSGTVKDNTTKEVVVGAIVSLYDSNNVLQEYTTTNKNGKFKIGNNKISSDFYLKISIMGYDDLKVKIANKSKFNLFIKTKEFLLKEVRVKAPRITSRGDTITYNTASFTSAKDKNIADIIKKMPGMEVEKSGKIKYQGREINKCYIEGTDMLGGNYTMATNNIDPNDVKALQVLENHEPVKALRDISNSENAALNIKLKDNAKSKWLWKIKAGMGGKPLLWDASLFAMSIGKKFQSMNTIKSNNIGSTIGIEDYSFSGDSRFNAMNNSFSHPTFMNVGTSSAPLNSERTRFNKSYYASTMSTYKLPKDYQLNVKASYLNESLDYNKFSETTYFLKDRNMSIKENSKANSISNTANLKAELLANTDNFYLKNNLNAQLNWFSIDKNISGNNANTQVGEINTIDIKNNLKYTQKMNRRIVEFNSYNEYKRSPHSLNVSDGKNLLRNQDITTSSFFSHTSASYGFYLGDIRFSLKGGIKFLNQDFNSHLKGANDIINGLSSLGLYDNNKTDSKLYDSKLYINPSFTYTNYKFKAVLSLSTNYSYTSLKNNIDKKDLINNQILYSPSLYMQYSLSPMLKLSSILGYSKNPVGTANMYKGVIMQNYRSFSVGNQEYLNVESQYINGYINYKDPINSLFINGSVNYTHVDNASILNQIVSSNYTISNTKILENDYNSLSFSMGISKGLDFVNGRFSLNTAFNKINSNMYQNGELSPYKTETWNINPKINASIFNNVDIYYSMNYKHYKLMNENNKSLSNTNSFMHSLSLDYSPIEKLNISLVGEHYYNELSKDLSKQLFLANLYLTYSVSKKIEIFAKATNLFDNTSYKYKTYSALSSTYCNYSIRPRNILVGLYLSL